MRVVLLEPAPENRQVRSETIGACDGSEEMQKRTNHNACIVYRRAEARVDFVFHTYRRYARGTHSQNSIVQLYVPSVFSPRRAVRCLWGGWTLRRGDMTPVHRSSHLPRAVTIAVSKDSDAVRISMYSSPDGPTRI